MSIADGPDIIDTRLCDERLILNSCIFGGDGRRADSAHDERMGFPLSWRIVAVKMSKRRRHLRSQYVPIERRRGKRAMQ